MQQLPDGFKELGGTTGKNKNPFNLDADLTNDRAGNLKATVLGSI